MVWILYVWFVVLFGWYVVGFYVFCCDVLGCVVVDGLLDVVV